MGSAISYTFHKEEYLRNFFKDGRCELSNNLAEQRIKPFVIARKNFLFSNTKNGAKASTIYFSLIESAKMNKLNPYKYGKSSNALTYSDYRDIFFFDAMLRQNQYHEITKIDKKDLLSKIRETLGKDAD